MPDVVDLIGVPFEIGGRGPKTYDCYGLLMELSLRDGIVIPDQRSYKDQKLAAKAMLADLVNWREIEERPGAVPLFRIRGLGAHVGYVLGPDKFIHTWEGSGGVCIERLTLWRPRIIGFYEYAGK